MTDKTDATAESVNFLLLDGADHLLREGRLINGQQQVRLADAIAALRKQLDEAREREAQEDARWEALANGILERKAVLQDEVIALREREAQMAAALREISGLRNCVFDGGNITGARRAFDVADAALAQYPPHARGIQEEKTALEIMERKTRARHPGWNGEADPDSPIGLTRARIAAALSQEPPASHAPGLRDAVIEDEATVQRVMKALCEPTRSPPDCTCAKGGRCPDKTRREGEARAAIRSLKGAT